MIAALVLVALGTNGGLAEDVAVSDETTPPGRIEFVGRNLFATANGTFHRWRIIEQTLDLKAIERSEVLVEVDLASVDTGNRRRDDHLRTPDFFEVETHPVARVRAHSARPMGSTEGGLPRYRVRFEIDLHGVSKTVEGEVWQVGESPPAFEGRLEIDRTDFGVGSPPSRWNPMSIEAEIPIRFRIAPGGASS